MLLGAGGLIGFIALALWIWGLIDCITTDADLCRKLPKFAWIVVVVLLFDVGVVLWILLGRPVRKRWAPTAATDVGPPRRSKGVEDRTDFSAPVTDRRSAELDRRLAEWEARERHPSEPTTSPIDDAPDPDAGRHDRNDG